MPQIPLSRAGTGRREDSFGIFAARHFSFAKSPEFMPLKSGRGLGPVKLACATCGTLNAAKSNAILVCPALSGDAHAASWWDDMIRPGKALAVARILRLGKRVIIGFPNFAHVQALNAFFTREDPDQRGA